MFRKLRCRLTLLTAALTGLVVLGIGAVLLSYTRGLYRGAQRTQLETTAASLEALWLRSDTLRYADLAELQRSSGLAALYLEENGHSLFGAWQHDGALVTDALAALAGSGANLSQPAPWEPAELQAAALFASARQPYRCALRRVRCGQDVRAILVIRSRAEEELYLRRMTLFFAAVVAAALLGVALAGWAVSGRAIRPLQTYLRQQEEFVAAAGHELKTPLAVLETGFALLDVRPDKRDAYLRMMRAETRRMQGLAAQLLDLARPQSGPASVSPRPVALAPFLAAYAGEAELLCRRAGAGFALRPAPGLPAELAVRVDPERLTQVLTILVDNAARFSPPGGEVTLALESRAGRAVLLVVDHGPGIAPAERARVFEKFYRGDASRTEKGHFGLGLALAKQLVTAQGGRIRVRDTPGGGATFAVSLPALPPRAVPRRAEAGTAGGPPAGANALGGA